jgi:hypothetical protein
MSGSWSFPACWRCMKQFAAHRPIYALIFAAYPVLFIAATNPGQAALSSVLLALLLVLLGGGLLLLTLRGALRRSWHAAALATSGVIVLFWSYELAAQAFVSVWPGQTPIPSDWILSALWTLLALTFAWCLRQIAVEKLERIAPGLNLAGAMLLVTLAGRFLISSDTGQSASSPTTGADSSVLAQPDAPDIYYIILDGYARADVLREHYSLDNVLVSDLRRRDFFVAPESSANYYWTFLSLASSLNMEYVESLLGADFDPTSRGRGRLYEAIRDNAAARFLKQRGYRFVHLRSTWGATLRNEHADQEIVCGRRWLQDEFLRTLIDSSWLRTTNAQVGTNLAECHVSQFAALSRQGAERGPKFVFAHFLLPHHPYLFDRDGNVLREATLSSQFEFQKKLWEDKHGYANQLLYVNQRVLATIDRILSESQRPPIIVLQSDHGPNLRDNLSLQQQKAVRFANLAAFHLPGAPAGLIPANVTPVNQFRHIFNHYFQSDFDILPVRRYYSEYGAPYMLEEDSDSAGAAIAHGTQPVGLSMSSAAASDAAGVRK